MNASWSTIAATAAGDAPTLPLRGACGFLFLLAFLIIFTITAVGITVAIVVAMARRSGKAQRDEITAAYREHWLLVNGLGIAITMVTGLVVFALVLGWVGWQRPGGLLLASLTVVPTIVVTLLVASNWVSLAGNQRLWRRVLALNPRGGWFVGVANPQAKSFFNQVVDTDDDFGLMRLGEEALVFEGAQATIRIPRAAVRRLRRPLVWQFAYLGYRWLEIHWQDGERPAIVRFSSREGKTLRACERHNQELAGRLESWSGQPGLADSDRPDA